MQRTVEPAPADVANRLASQTSSNAGMTLFHLYVDSDEQVAVEEQYRLTRRGTALAYEG